MAGNFEPKITAKGTELPLLNLRGKPYLQVAHRLVWFVEENPNYHITTEYLKITDDESVIKATIFILDDKGQAVRKVSATKRETKEGFSDHLEKAETGAIGRGLAMLGYGTQFAPELDEGSRLADAPVDLAKTVPLVVTEVMAKEEKVVRPSFRNKKVDAPKEDLF